MRIGVCWKMDSCGLQMLYAVSWRMSEQLCMEKGASAESYGNHIGKWRKKFDK